MTSHRRRRRLLRGPDRRGPDLERRPDAARRSARPRTTSSRPATGPDRPLGPQRGHRHDRRRQRRGGIDGTLVGSPTWVAGYGFPQDTSGTGDPGRLRRHAGRRRERPCPGRPTASRTSRATTCTAARACPVSTSGTPLNGASLVQTDDLHRHRARQRHDLPLRPGRGRWRRQPLDRCDDGRRPRAQPRPHGRPRRARRRRDRHLDVTRPVGHARRPRGPAAVASRSSAAPTPAACSRSIGTNTRRRLGPARPPRRGPRSTRASATSGT